MTNILDDIENYFASKYKTNRSDIDNAKRLTLSHLGKQVHIDSFTTGTLSVSGTKKSSLREEVDEIVEKLRADPQFFQRTSPAPAHTIPATPEQNILAIINIELYEFLSDHDRQALVAAFQVLNSDLSLPNFSPATMPIARTYEGFLAKVLVKLGLCTQTTLEDVNFTFHTAFDSSDAKIFRQKVTTHSTQLDAAKQRLKEFRHVNLHSQSSQFLSCTTAPDARRFAARVLNDMQDFYNYFKKYFVS